MSQQILGWNDERILLACDSKVMSWQENGAVARGSVRKMCRLGSHALICSTGLEAGVDMCLALKDWVEGDGMDDFTEIDRLAREFLRREYHRFLLQRKPWFESHPEAPRLLYFTLAGYSRREGRCRAFVLESQDLKLPFQEMEIGDVITIPRALTTETRLRRLWSDPGQPLGDLAGFCVSSLKRIAASDGWVGGPYQAAAVTARGVQFFADLPGSSHPG